MTRADDSDDARVTNNDTSHDVKTAFDYCRGSGLRPWRLRGPRHDGVLHGRHPPSSRVRGRVYLPQHEGQSSLPGKVINRKCPGITHNETYSGSGPILFKKPRMFSHLPASALLTAPVFCF